jgi:curved DNA-binding protein CbpA
MRSSGGSGEEEERIPRLSPAWEWQSATLTPAEGFVLSRIDGHTPWSALRQIGGIAPADVDGILERWAKEGWIEVQAVEQPQCPAKIAPEAAPEAPAPRSGPAPDPSLDLSVELQERIFDYEARLESSYHDLLGVTRAAEGRDIKRAYFRLSKDFHPDRYFRRNIGDFGPRLDRIFKKVAEAYELLSDPTTRKEIEMSLGPEPAPAAPEQGAYSGAGVAKEKIGPDKKPSKKQVRVPTRMENLQKLRSRFKMPKKLRAERQFRARQFYQTAKVAVHEKRWLEAAASMRLAIAFDPWNAEFKSAFAEIQADVHKMRAAELIAMSKETLDHAEALRMVEEALHYLPCDLPANLRAAEIALETKELDKALEYAENLCDLDPSVPLHQILAARALRRLGRKSEARQALERGAELNASDPAVMAERLQQRRTLGAPTTGGKR